MSRRRILFLVNGLGLGNSTRCYAVIRELTAAGAEVEVVTSDNGLWFFSDKSGLHGLTEIPSLRYGAKGGRISVAATLAQAGGMVATLRAVDRIITRRIADFRPHAVATDSTYSFRPVRRAGLPLAALNNADMVGRSMRIFRDWPPAVLPQFLFVELADFLYHATVPDLVISPRLDPADHAQWGHFRRVAPIVRSDCVAGAPSTGRPTRVVIMLSGSVFGSPVDLRNPPAGVSIDVVGRPPPRETAPPAGVTYHGRVRDSVALIRQADLVMVNGGFSAVSEALMLRKPMVVIPVPRHAEQWVNGRVIHQLGVGTTAAEEQLETSLHEALARIDGFRRGYDRLPPVPNGAVQAAQLILGLAEGRAP